MHETANEGRSPEQIDQLMEELAKQLGMSVADVLEEVVGSSIAMGGLTVVSRPKAPVLRLVETKRDL